MVQSSRPVQIIVGGEIVAETRRARFLFETRLPTACDHIPPEDVRMDLLNPEREDYGLPLQGPGVLLFGQDLATVFSRTGGKLP